MKTKDGERMTAPNAQTKGLDVDATRAVINAYLRGDHPNSLGSSLRNFCLQVCDPTVDPSNLSDFLRGKRDGMAAQTVATIAQAVGLRPSDLYTDRDDDAKARKERAQRIRRATGQARGAA